MKIALNTVNLQDAGGLTVALNFINSVKSDNKCKLIVFAPRDKGYEEFEDENIKIVTIPKLWSNRFLRLFVDYYWLPKKIKESSANVVFTMGNFAVPTDIPQGVLFMWPYAIYPEDEIIWGRMSYKDTVLRKIKIKNFRDRLKYATIVFPQTLTAERRLIKYYSKFIKKTAVIPMAFSNIGDGTSTTEALFKREENVLYLLCLTRYYPHKNVEVFIELGKRIKSLKVPVRIVTTIGEHQHVDAFNFIKNLKLQELDDVIINIGPVPIKSVPSLYSQVDGMILPTLLESFSATYVDSMRFGKPIFTSNLDFAVDACRDSAFYFDPLSADSILEQIMYAFNNPELIEKKISIGRERNKEMPNWDMVTMSYLTSLENISIKEIQQSTTYETTHTIV